ncbi:hypothetical protein ACFSTH_17155 [Paenibacillus yanchengensis]|uniref:Uncharacterized protein n=1 Tax=Paenibacillus yanchengensis TaxID=2035833 RepID=A0ABW4YQP1_9BACL
MILYHSQQITEIQFMAFEIEMERRNQQWVDVILTPQVSETTPLPTDLNDFTIYVVCFASDASIMQIIPQNEGCDCEYLFTVLEKEQIRQFIEQPDIQKKMMSLPLPW